MKQISKEAEDKIASAIDRAKDLIDTGLTPNDAIVKAASESDLPVHQVGLLVYAYNNGTTNLQRKSHSDPFSKSADFPVAVLGDIVEKLYPTDVKAASVQELTKPSAEYNRPPDWLRDVDQMEKAAAEFHETPKAAAYPREEGRHVYRAEAAMVALEREREQQRFKVTGAFDKVSVAMDDLDHYFRLSGNGAQFAEVRENVKMAWGDYADRVMEKVASVNPFLTKEAHRGPLPAMDMRVGPYKLIVNILNAVEDYTEIKQAFDTFEKEAYQAGIKLAGYFLPPIQKPRGLSILKQLALEKQGFIPGAVTAGMEFGVGKNIADQIGSQLGPKPKDNLQTEALMAMEDPAHEARLRSIRAQATLHDIMANDEFVSGEDPVKVTKLYNEITKLSPRSADQPMLVRALLRRYLAQGQVDPHDVDQLAGIEGKMKVRDEPMREQSLPKVPGSNLVAQPPKLTEVRK